MRTYTLFIYIILATLLSACVDRFEADLPSSATRVLVVEGNICSQTDCLFLLSHSVNLEADASSVADCLISDATMAIHGDDSQSWTCQMTSPGHYIAQIGTLSPTAHYWAEINWKGNRYCSTPLSPIATPAIEALTWEQPRADREVDILVTPSRQGGTQYYKWDFEEFWEINTPLRSLYEYIPALDSIALTSPQYYRGWCQQSAHKTVISASNDYADGQIRNLRLYHLAANDDRFNTRYCTRVTQTAISREQYEYERLSQQMSDEMGGLFTPQPSALPTNIICQSDHLPAIGYIGVSLNTSTSTLYINSREVGHQSQHLVSLLSENEAKRHSWAELYAMNYRVYQYFPDFNSVSWVSRWCVDCTDSTWGATTQRPSFWED